MAERRGGEQWRRRAECRRFPVVSAASFAGKPVPERLWIVLDMIPSGTVTLFTGDGGVGKSRLVKQLGIAVAVGREWIGDGPNADP